MDTKKSVDTQAVTEAQGAKDTKATGTSLDSSTHKLVVAHEAFLRSGATLDIAFRRNALKKLLASIKAHEHDIAEALNKDLSKSEFEAYATETSIVYDELHTAIRRIAKWSRPRRVKTPLLHFRSKSHIYPEPYGTVLVMSPWNYPFQLCMVPLIGAIAAGNCVVVKPSEYSFHTSEIIEKIIRECFDESYVSVVRGGREANQHLLDERFDYIFFTGSPVVGHVVMEAAAKHLTPITLELGGKSPCIVDSTADIAIAAKRIVWGKLLNSGQTCIAPDYFFVHESIKDELVEEMKKAIVSYYGLDARQNPDYPCIINEKHFKRLSNLMTSEGKILCGGWSDEASRKIAPTIIDGITSESPIMQEEIFGPLMPIMTFKTLDEVYDFVLSRPKPLAMYFFSEDKKAIKRTINTLSFGGGCINDTITHIANPNLPFGGVGNSGMGQYHGRLSFDTFTHYKSVLTKALWPDIPLRYAPFTSKNLSLLKKLMK